MADATRILEADPDLALALPPADLQAAKESLIAHTYDLPPGPWEVETPTSDPGALGLLVLGGVLGLRTELHGRANLELVGHGDVLRPWVRLDADATVLPNADWRVIEPSRVALLDARFAAALAEWPPVTAALMHRLVVRSRRLCYQLAANASPRTEDRVLYALWALSDRWGRVTERGVMLRLSLSHQQIAELVGAQRPSVSAALSRLRHDGRLEYARGSFVLCGDVPEHVADLEKQVGLKT